MGAFDISRNAFDPAKHYTSVRMQQGRVLTDDDWNENERIENEGHRRELTEIVGPYGSPDDGFKIKDLRNETRFVNFDILPGVMYLGGLRLEMDPAMRQGTVVPESYLTQRDWLSKPDDYPWPQNYEITGPRYDMVYLETWQQGVSAVEDNELFEAALAGPDTTTRVRNMRRVKVATDVGHRDCLRGWEALIGRWNTELLGEVNRKHERVVDTHLQVGFTEEGTGDDLCVPRIAGSYLGAENQAIRVQLVDATHFTWGFDNASPYYRVRIVNSSVIEFLDLPKDQHHWPLVGDNVELLAWSALLPNGEKVAETMGHLTKLAGSYNPDTHEATLSVPVPMNFNTEWLDRPDATEISGGDLHVYLRVWNRGDDTTSPASIPLLVGANVLGNTGLTVTITGNDRVAGDFWVIAARPETPEDIVPWRLEHSGMQPMGFRRFLAPLAVIRWTIGQGQEVEGTIIHDCRKTFRPLTDIESCCTLHVGDGRMSFGDYNDLQEAIDNLPEWGGKVCVLHGIHRVNATIIARANITISGCGLTSILFPKNEGMDFPIISIANSSLITIEGLTFLAPRHRAIQLIDSTMGAPSAAITIQRNLIIAVRNGIYIHTDDINSANNSIHIARNLVAIPNLEAAGVGIFCLADNALIEWNHVMVVPLPEQTGEPGEDPGDLFDPCECDDEEEQDQWTNYIAQTHGFISANNWTIQDTYVALGGIQIGGSSEGVRLRENTIAGGASNGITLGHFPSGLDLPNVYSYQFPPSLVVDFDNLHHAALTTADTDLNTMDPYVRSMLMQYFKSTLYDIQIERNTITGMGLAGVGAISFFFYSVAEENLVSIVEDLLVERNQIRRCAQQIPAVTRVSGFIGYGGVALGQVNRGVFVDNMIQDCGQSSAEPICGIYIMTGEKFSISRNRILNNGPEPHTLIGEVPTNNAGPTRAGSRAGIFIAFATKTDNAELILQQIVSDGLPAAQIHDNIVVQPLGQALYILTIGPVSVEGNNFTSQDQDIANFLSFIASTVFILNLGVSKDALALAIEPTFSQLPGNTPTTYDPGQMSIQLINLILYSLQYLPTGQVLFNDNQVTFDQRDLEMDLTYSSTAIYTLDDISFCSNQLECLGVSLLVNEEDPEPTPLDTMATDVLMVGYTLRTADNRFQEGFTQTAYSLVSGAPWNTTTGNQASNCLLTFGSNQHFANNFHGILTNNDCNEPERTIGTRTRWQGKTYTRGFGK